MFGFRSRDTRSLELVMLPSIARPPDTRAIRRFHPNWLYCRVHNKSDQPLFVYGPRYSSDETTLPTSLFILPRGSSTPKLWDCKGILIPSGRTVAQGSLVILGPVALKYRDLRRITVTEFCGEYRGPRSDGIREPGGIDFAVPELSYLELLPLPRRRAVL
jgi:hypothetical protein